MSSKTTENLFDIARERFYKVYDFDPKTKSSDRAWIRVGLIPDPNKEIRWNFFNGEELLCDEPFDKAEVFENGTTVVIRNGKYNVLRDDGTFVLGTWYDYVAKCSDGKHLIVEQKTDEYGIIRIEAIADFNGKFVTEWFDQIMPMLYENYWCVSKGQNIQHRKSAILNLDTCEIVSEWYDSLMMFQWKDYIGKPLARIKKDNTYNLIDTDGRQVFSIWSVKPIEVNKDGSCQITSEDRTVYNANAVTGEILESVNGTKS